MLVQHGKDNMSFRKKIFLSLLYLLSGNNRTISFDILIPGELENENTVLKNLDQQ